MTNICIPATKHKLYHHQLHQRTHTFYVIYCSKRTYKQLNSLVPHCQLLYNSIDCCQCCKKETVLLLLCVVDVHLKITCALTPAFLTHMACDILLATETWTDKWTCTVMTPLMQTCLLAWQGFMGQRGQRRLSTDLSHKRSTVTI